MVFPVVSSMLRMFGQASCKPIFAQSWHVEGFVSRISVSTFRCKATFETSRSTSIFNAHTDGCSTRVEEADKQRYGSAPPPRMNEYPKWVDEMLPSELPSKRKIFCNRALNMRQVQAIGFNMDYTLAQYRPEQFEALAHADTAIGFDMDYILAQYRPEQFEALAHADTAIGFDMDYTLAQYRPEQFEALAHADTAIGFDMDYTLAQYRPEQFEALAHAETVKKLVQNFGYPEELHTWTFQWDYMMKGLIIDKKRGTVLKVDRHGYVKAVTAALLDCDNRAVSMLRAVTAVLLDCKSLTELAFDEPEYGMVDTLFSLAEAYLYMQLVELKDEGQHAMLESKSYANVYGDLRAAVDMCHRDGSLKKAVAANPEEFIHYDPLLPQMLEILRKSGRRVFLATNSLWDYTNVVMNYLINNKTGTDKDHTWMDYFDVVMVGCSKPHFFLTRGQLFSVDIQTGHLRNTDNGAPMCAIDDDGGAASVPNSFMLRSVEGPGDGDAESSGSDGGERMKGANRNILVLPELEHELEQEYQSEAVYKELQLLRKQRDNLDDQIQRYDWAISRGNVPMEPKEYEKNLELLAEMRSRRQSLKARHSILLSDHHHGFHPIWGQLLKTGHQNSRFAHQMERFACLYTSHVSNLAFHSPDKSYVGRMDYMAHEKFPPFPSSLTAVSEEGKGGMGKR
eukprot:gene13253-19095_t